MHCLIFFVVVIESEQTNPLTYSLHLKGIILRNLQRPDPRDFEGVLFFSKSTAVTYLL